MEALLIVLGAVALVPAFMALGVLISMWRAWWLHPLWALLLVPLGVPPIGFWNFLAIGMFLHAWLAWRVSGESDSGEKGEWSKTAGKFVMLFLWPVITFYFVGWYLS